MATRNKRRRTGGIIGAPSEDDDIVVDSLTTDAALSTREVGIPTLASISARVFVLHIKDFDEDSWRNEIGPKLLMLPEYIIPKIFAMLCASHPTLLNHSIISKYFMRGNTVTLTKDLPGVTRATLASIGKMAKELTELELRGFDFPDKFFASVVEQLSSLKKLVLRGCTNVGASTVESAAKCASLRIVNFSSTAVTPVAIAGLIMVLPLEVLKLAGVPNWTDATFAKLISALTAAEFTIFPSLQTLKLRHTSLTDNSLQFIIALCPNLRRLDLSFTLIRRTSCLTPPSDVISRLEKLSLTSTGVSCNNILSIISHASALRVLSIGALGGGQATSASLGSGAMIMSDEFLQKMTDILRPFKHLEHINLVGNSKLGTVRRTAVSNFITKVGRRCKSLNLANITALRSSDLFGLSVSDEEPEPSPLEILILNNTGVDDDAALSIASCTSLLNLEVARSRFTPEGLFLVINACKKLQNLNLTATRGIPLAHRKSFFEFWAENR